MLRWRTGPGRSLGLRRPVTGQPLCAYSVGGRHRRNNAVLFPALFPALSRRDVTPRELRDRPLRSGSRRATVRHSPSGEHGPAPASEHGPALASEHGPAPASEHGPAPSSAAQPAPVWQMARRDEGSQRDAAARPGSENSSARHSTASTTLLNVTSPVLFHQLVQQLYLQ